MLPIAEYVFSIELHSKSEAFNAPMERSAVTREGGATGSNFSRTFVFWNRATFRVTTLQCVRGVCRLLAGLCVAERRRGWRFFELRSMYRRGRAPPVTIATNAAADFKRPGARDIPG